MATWTIDPMHSEVQFKVKHLVISTVTGSFKTYSATVTTDGDNFDNAKVHFEADTKSIDTGVEQRDQHLQGDDFFNSEKFPKLTFESKSFSGSKLTGDLTIRDVTKEVTLDVEFGGKMTDFYGNEKAGFEVTGKINRKEFGLQWAAVTEAGGIVVGDDVKLIANIQLQKQA
ncbi:MAG: YceI family protein [Bacteroidota bacterium]